MDKAVHNFQIIRHVGELNTAMLPDGKTMVKRLSHIYVPEHQRLYKVINDDVHFIYEIPKSVEHLFPGPIHRCTCGSYAVLTGPSGYNWGQDDTVLYFACYFHMTFGVHQGMSKWI